MAADPKFVAPYLHLAALLATRASWPDVIAVSDKAIELGGDAYTEPYYFRAAAYLMSKRVPEAKPNVAKVLETDKDHRFPRAELMMGNILRGEGNDAEAAEHFRNYIKLEPRGPDVPRIQEYLLQIGQQSSPTEPPKEKH